MLGGREQNLIWTRPLQTPGHRVCHTRVEKDNLVAATFPAVSIAAFWATLLPGLVLKGDGFSVVT